VRQTDILIDSGTARVVVECRYARPKASPERLTNTQLLTGETTNRDTAIQSERGLFRECLRNSTYCESTSEIREELATDEATSGMSFATQMTTTGYLAHILAFQRARPYTGSGFGANGMDMAVDIAGDLFRKVN